MAGGDRKGKTLMLSWVFGNKEKAKRRKKKRPGAMPS